MKRYAGVLLPVTSLPSKYGIGCFDQAAYDFVDWLQKAGQRYWQILPLGATSYGISDDSPYQAYSAFAGNPYLISLDALVNGTSLLKGIATNAPVRAIGKNTVESMQSGVVFGAASMLDGMVERFEAELGPAKTLVATGGAAGIVVPHCRHSVQYVPTLILDGLYAVYCRTHAAL